MNTPASSSLRTLAACVMLAAFTNLADAKAPRRTPVLKEIQFQELAGRTYPVPESPDSPSWHHRVYVESYRQYGMHHPQWSDLVEYALDLDIGALSGLAHTEPDHIRDAYRAAIDAGCLDALVLYRHARAKDRSEDLDYIDRRVLFTEAAIAMAESPYPAFIKCWSFVRAARYQPAPNNAQSITQRANMSILLDAILEMVPLLLEDEGMKPIEIGALVDYFARAYGARYGSKEKGHDRIYDRFAELAPDKKIILLTLRANYYKKIASDARGSSYAYTVSEDNWELYGERLKEALEALLEIWELDSTDPDVAAQIQQIYAQWCDPRAEVWYRKALELDPEHRRTRAIKMHFLQPKWGGSIEELIRFGKECFATEYWNTRVAFMLVDAHLKAADAFDHAGRRAYLNRPEVWKDFRLVYDTYLSDHPDAHWDRSRFASHAVTCERWEEADALLRELGTNVNPRAFGGPPSYSNALLSIAHQLHGEEIPGSRASPELLAAIIDGDTNALTALLERGERVDARDEKDRSLLWRAIKSGQVESVRVLVEHGADVREKPFGKYPVLFTAISADNIEMTRILLDNGADARSWDTKKNYNALTTAVKKRNPQMIAFLLERGARIESRDKKRNCALIKAASLGFPDMVALLVHYGADLESRNSWQYTPLMTAAAGGKRSVVEELIRLGGEVDAKTTLDTTAFANASVRGNTEIMEVLLDAGADINVLNKQENMTPLMSCAENGHFDAAKLLLTRGADRELRNRHGKTASELAAERGYPELAAMIVNWQQ